jgi:hypothetical protein
MNPLFKGKTTKVMMNHIAGKCSAVAVAASSSSSSAKSMSSVSGILMSRSLFSSQSWRQSPKVSDQLYYSRWRKGNNNNPQQQQQNVASGGGNNNNTGPSGSETFQGKKYTRGGNGTVGNNNNNNKRQWSGGGVGGGGSKEVSQLFVPVPVKLESEGYHDVGAELTGKLKKQDLLKVLNKFFRRSEVKLLSLENGLDSKKGYNIIVIDSDSALGWGESGLRKGLIANSKVCVGVFFFGS